MKTALYKAFTPSASIFYAHSDLLRKLEISSGGILSMSAFRTCRPLLIDAEQCSHARTITTDTGFRHVHKGEWIINGEDGECYVVDDAFFQRTFAPIQSYPWETSSQEGRNYGC